MALRMMRSLSAVVPVAPSLPGYGDFSRDTSVALSPSSVVDWTKLRFSTDEELAARFQSGKADALAVLFERHSGVVFRIARRILRGDAEAEDTVQQVFLDCFRAVDKFDPDKGTFKTWLLMFAYHRTLNRRRQLQSTQSYDTVSLDDVPMADLDPNAKQPFRYLPAEAICLVDRALELIQPRQRLAIELIYYEGLTAEEVSERTGETVRVVRHNFYRGMEKLRSILCENKPDK
jgi:RNA polymerase sigma-70 factor (ECF subfamily)